MKKFLIMSAAFLVLLGVNNCSYASDNGKIQTISEIGTLSNADKYDEALKKCDSAIQKYPDEPELYYWRGAIKSHLGDNLAALVDYDKAIQLKPNEGIAYVMRGISKSDLGDNSGAMKDFNKALEINPKDSSAYSMRACVKIDMGDLQGANEDLEIANKLYDESIPKEQPQK